MPFCAKCGAGLAEAARFCPKCGAPAHGVADLGDVITGALVTAGREIGEAFRIAGQELEKAFGEAKSDLSDRRGPFCIKCGKRNPLGADFCFSCGTRIPSTA